MPTDVPSRPERAVLDRLFVGNAVSSAHGQHWCAGLNFLLGRCVEQVAACGLPQSSNDGIVYPIAYTRGIGAKLFLLAAEAWESDDGRYTLSAVRESAGTLTAVGYAPYNGSSVLTTPATLFVESHEERGIFLATDFTVGTADTLLVTYARTAGATEGLKRLSLVEIPLGSLDVSGSTPTDAGIDSAWPTRGNRLVNAGGVVGSFAVGPYGTLRLISEMDAARYKQRRHLQIVAGEHSTVFESRAIYTTSAAFANPVWPHAVSGSYTPTFYLRARRLYATSVTNKYKLRVRYRVNDAANTGSIRVKVDSPATDYDMTLGTSTTYTSVESASAFIQIPCSTTDQEVQVQVQLKVTAGTVAVSNIALIEDES